MINDQITDSVTQIINYKEGMGSGKPTKITFKYHQDCIYDQVINDLSRPWDFHIPSIEECKILHEYLGRVIMPKNYMTSEALDQDHVTLAYLRDGVFIQSDRRQYHSVVLVQIEYQP